VRSAAPRPGAVFAALTGDLVASRHLSAERLERARRLVARGAAEFRRRHPHAVCGVPQMFRGDAWQLLLREPRWALRMALLIRALLLAENDVTTRIAIGVGGVDVVNRRRISVSTGEAFVLSGHALDRITGYFDLTGALPDRAGPVAGWFPALLHLCSGLVRPWTRRQAEIVSLALVLKNPTHDSIAHALRPRVSKQTVTESLAAARWRPLLEGMRIFEETDWAGLLAVPAAGGDSLSTLSGPRQAGQPVSRSEGAR
jgi:hypothetical protein